MTPIQKAENVLKVWRMHDISILGKTNIINTRVGSLFIYKMQVIPTMTEDMIEALHTIFCDISN